MVTFRTNGQFLVIVLATIIIISTNVGSKAGNVEKRTKQCGTLFTENESKGGNHSMFDGSKIGNLTEQLAVDSVWNSSLSFTVNEGCGITVCNDTHFNGYCQEFSESSNNEFGTISSASCSCKPIPTTGPCSDIWMRRSSCARAYLGGCNVSNPIYTDLKDEKPFFPTEVDRQIGAIKVRDGCSLAVFSQEEFDGENILVNGTIENWVGTIGSYNCSCSKDDQVQLPKKSPPRPSNYPVLIDVPKSIENVSLMLNNKQFKRHPGLMAALTSLKNKRSSKNVYILTIGSTGAGKSSAINLLFDNPIITSAGGKKSTTTDIHEFRIKVPIDELGIQNSELRVIDTPGLGDTRGIEQDAKFLATFDDYLANHEDLKHRIPNVVLIFHKFHDNRFDGEGSVFVKMLRGLDAFRKKITDENYSNVIFVFSHFMSESSETVSRPKRKLLEFKDVIEEYTLFPKPILMAVAENKAAAYELLPFNGYYKLPNGDYYPRNIFDLIQSTTTAGGDPIGNAVISSAFRDSDDFNVSSITHKLVESNTNKVFKYYNLLASVNFDTENSEISQMLKTAYEEMDPKLKERFPEALPTLQRALSIRNIISRSDIPQTTKSILELLASLKHNQATLFLLEKGLELEPPIFDGNVLIGYGYNVFKDIPLHKSPFNLEEKINSDIGYLLPSAMSCNVVSQVSDFAKWFPTRSEYIRNRLSSLGIQGEMAKGEFSGELKVGSFVADEDFLNNSCQLSAVREFRTFQIILNERPKLAPDFETILRNLPVFNETDSGNVKIWNDFFDEYGTHVVKSAFGGGAIEIHVKSNRTCDLRFLRALFELVQFVEDLTFLSDNSSALLLRGRVEHHLKFRGGDPKYHSTGLTNMTLDDASLLLSNWKKSLRVSPIMLTTEIQILPISFVARRVGKKQNITKEIERATTLRFNSTLKLSRPTSLQNLPGPGREEIPKYKFFRGFVQDIKNYFGIGRKETTKKGQEREVSKNTVIARNLKTSCLRQGTQILLANKTGKSVENIKIGDVILDHELNPTRVIAISYEFLGEQTFYGFDNDSFFFTDSHILIGPGLNQEIQLYVKDLKVLLDENPLMKFLNVLEMKSSKKLQMFAWEESNSSLSTKSFSVFKDHVTHPADTRIYFLLVDSPSGTYFANGHVCRHEIPPIHIWPNTMAIFLQVYSIVYPNIKLLAEVPFTLEMSFTLRKIVAKVQETVQDTLDVLDSDIKNLEKNVPKIDLDFIDVRETFLAVRNYPTVRSFATAIYAATSKMIAEYVDSNDRGSQNFEPYVGSMQRVIIDAMAKKISKSLHDHFDHSQLLQ